MSRITPASIKSPAETHAGFANAEPNVETAIHQQRNLSVDRNSHKSIKSLLKRASRGISRTLSSLFTAKPGTIKSTPRSIFYAAAPQIQQTQQTPQTPSVTGAAVRHPQAQPIPILQVTPMTPVALPDEPKPMVPVLPDAEAAPDQVNPKAKIKTPTPWAYDPLRYRSRAYRGLLAKHNVTGTGFKDRDRIGPFSYPDVQNYLMSLRPACPVADAAADWCSPVDRANVSSALRRVAVGQHQGNMEALANFFNKLGSLKPNGQPLRDDASFRAFMQTWITQIAESPTLLEESGEIAFDATTSCADRVLLTLNRLQAPRVLDDIRNGKYNNPADLIAAGRRLFRLERLAAIAATEVDRQLAVKMKSPERYLPKIPASELAKMDASEIKAELRKNSEELAVYLHLQVANMDLLDLQLPANDMFFGFASGLTYRQVTAAGERVKEQENTGFAAWFSQWPPCGRMLETQYSTEYAKAMDRKQEMMRRVTETLEAAIDAELKQKQASKEIEPLESMTPHEIMEVRNGLGKARTERVESNVMIAITKKFLNEKGLGEALNPHWT
jgi:hypothetical protein